MEAQKVFFNPLPNVTYKVVSVIDGNKAFTLQEGTNKLILNDFTGAANQIWHVYNNNFKYALVNLSANHALHVENENKANGGVVRGDAGQFASSYFEIESVTKGEWAGKACHLKTFAQGQALDIKGGKANNGTEICQWAFHGQSNQQWVITPVETLAHDEVPANFQPNPAQIYKVVSACDANKVFTIDGSTHKLHVKDYVGDQSQQFFIHNEQGKYAFVAVSTQQGLSIYQDNKDNNGVPLTDNGKHPSSWFDLSRAAQGKWAKKGYIIKTHAGNKALDIAGGKANEGTNVIQYNIHGNDNQIWIIVPVEPSTAHPDVPTVFAPVNGSQYKIISALDPTKSLTIGQDNKLAISTYTGDVSQKFAVYYDHGKYGFIHSGSKNGLCIYQDSKDNNGVPVTDHAKHPSSQFELVKWANGKWANKAYLIKTHAGDKALDIAGGKANDGTKVIQYGIHGNENQLWILEAVEHPQSQWAGKHHHHHHHHGHGHHGFFGGHGQHSPQKQQQQNNSPFHWGSQLATNIVPFSIGGFVSIPTFKPNQNYILYAVHSNGLKAIDVDQSGQNFGGLILYNFHGAPNQRFTFEQEGNFYRIKGVSTGKYIRLAAESNQDTVPIKVDDKGSKVELWAIENANGGQYSGKGAYHIKSVFGKALEVAKGSLENCAKIQQASFNGSEGQTWVIKEI